MAVKKSRITKKTKKVLKDHLKKNTKKMVDAVDKNEELFVEFMCWYAVQQHVRERLDRVTHDLLVSWAIEDVKNGVIDLSEAAK